MSAETIVTGGGGERLPRKIAVLGFANTVFDAPFSDPSWEMWGMNGLWRRLTDVPEARFSAWFDIHSKDYLERHSIAAGIGSQQLDWLAAKHPFPIYHHEAREEWPSSVAFPIDEIISVTGRDYFTSSVAYELAYITYLYLCGEPVDEVGVWGIDLVHGTEWEHQRPCAEYWIGRLQGMGIKVTVHEKSALLKSPGRYGYEPDNPLLVSMRSYIAKQLEHHQKAKDEATAEAERLIQLAQCHDGGRQMASMVWDELEKYARGAQ